MRLVTAYLSVVLIWGTTPLAISISNALGGYSFAAAARMLVGLACIGALVLATRTRVPFDRAAVATYVAGGGGIFGAMGLTYWAAERIPSGWISVVFGVSPLLTAGLSALVLKERSITAPKVVGMLLGVAGLTVIFASGAAMGPRTLVGVLGIVLGAFIHAGSAVAIKAIGAPPPPPPAQAFGGMLIAVPCFCLLWAAHGAPVPDATPARPLAALVYLGVVASTLGFTLYFFLLSNLPATRVALILLVTPVLGLTIGCVWRGEPFTWRIAVGTVMILCGLIVHEGAAIRGASPLTAARALRARRRAPAAVPGGC